MNSPVHMGERPSISELCRTYYFKPSILAILTGIPEQTI